MSAPEPDLLVHGRHLRIAGEEVEIERRAGTDARPIVRVSGCASRAAADALRGEPLVVARADLPPLDEDEFWAQDLVGCAVRDGARSVGTVRRLLGLPSCDVLEVARGGEGEGDDLLVPLVRDAVRRVDVAARVVDVDLAFLGEDGGGAPAGGRGEP